jgi:hypothetical protein
VTAAAPPISSDQEREIAQGEARAKRFKLAGTLATLNGGTLIAIAVIAALSGLFDPSSLFAVVPCAALAFVELRGRARLRLFDPSALRMLTFNQLTLVALVTLYAVVQIRTAMNAPSPFESVANADTAALADELGLGELNEVAADEDLAGMVRSATVAFYGLVIALTALFQGGCALYYWTRQKPLEAFLRETPEWVVKWLRERAG